MDLDFVRFWFLPGLRLKIINSYYFLTALPVGSYKW